MSVCPSAFFWRTTLLKRFTVPLALVFVTACVSVQKSVLMPGLAPVETTDVQIFFDYDENICAHDRVALLNAEGNSSLTNRGKMIEKMREEAAKLGANGIILMGIKEPSTGEKAVNAALTGMNSGMRKGEALAIRCKE